MMNNWKKWAQMALVGILALSLTAPLSLAGDRRGPVSRDGYYQYSDRSYGYRDSDYRNQRGYGYGYGDYRRGRDRDRSTGESVAIVGGSAAGGAALGAIMGGGKGAAIGAVVGALGGLVVDRATADNDRNRGRYRSRR